MRSLLFICLLFSLCFVPAANAQEPFIEGALVYKVVLQTRDSKTFTGIYTFLFKGGRIRKELKLDNGYSDVLLMNCNDLTAYSLQAANGRKYAIQLNMDEIGARQERYVGYTLQEHRNIGKIIAGVTAFKGEITYPNGTHSEIYYSADWYPDQSVTFERFPNARFMPLSFEYKDDNGFDMHMEAEKISAEPVENAVFAIPADYKIISNKEYKQLRSATK